MSSPGMNNLVRGMPFSQEDKMHGCIEVSLLSGREKRDIMLAVFTPFF